MNIETTKESVCINQLLGQKTENKVIEGDMIVPDIKQDVLNIIQTTGNICIYKKEVMDDQIKIDGTLQVYVIYSADDVENRIRSLSTSIDFSEIIKMPQAKNGMSLILNSRIINVDSKILNGRKISIRGNVAFTLKLYSNEEISIVKDIQGVDNMQKLSHEVEVNSLIGSGITKSFAKETIMIEQTDNLAEVLDVEIQVINKDIKLSFNKVLVKADTYIKIIYLTDDGRICSCETVIPTMGFVDMQNVNDNNYCETYYEIKNILIKQNGEDDHSIYAEVEFEISCLAFEKKIITIIEDIYSPTNTVSFVQNDIRLVGNKSSETDLYTIRESVSAPEIMNGKICSTKVKPSITAKEVLQNHVRYTGEVQINILYTNDDMLNTKEIILPLSFLANIQDVSEKTEIDTELEVHSKDVIINSDGTLDLKIDIDFIINESSLKDISVIDEISVDEKTKLSNYSVVIYFTKQGDTLWKIAKRFGSTMDEIARANEIENLDSLQIGKQLYIPRYSLRRTA